MVQELALVTRPRNFVVRVFNQVVQEMALADALVALLGWCVEGVGKLAVASTSGPPDDTARAQVGRRYCTHTSHISYYTHTSHMSAVTLASGPQDDTARAQEVYSHDTHISDSILTHLILVLSPPPQARRIMLRGRR